MILLIRLLIRSYQTCISPLLATLTGPNGGCRFQPTCSQYFLVAAETHGVWRGSWLGVKRLLRCHPWGGQGFDPVPEEGCCGDGRTHKSQKAPSDPTHRHSRAFRSAPLAARSSFSKYGS